MMCKRRPSQPARSRGEPAKSCANQRVRQALAHRRIVGRRQRRARERSVVGSGSALDKKFALHRMTWERFPVGRCGAARADAFGT
jgi:hypothetical protein